MRFGLFFSANIHFVGKKQPPAPTDQALQLLLHSMIASIMKRLVRQGVLVQEQDQWYVADGITGEADASSLRPLQQGSIVYRIAFGPRAGRKVLTLREACRCNHPDNQLCN